MSHTKSERNAEIVRRARAGQQAADIAAEFNVSLSRVYQILKAATPATPAAPAPDRLARAPGIVRPRLRKRASGQWECTDGDVCRAARTCRGAYERWLTAVTARAHSDVRPSQPAASVDRPTPAQSAPAPRVMPVPEPYKGEVQVLAGTAACRPLTLAPAMRQALERARAAQPVMRSLGGVREGVA